MDMIKKFNALERQIRHARYNVYEITRDDLDYMDDYMDETDTTAAADNAPQADANHDNKSTQTEGERDSAEQENDKSTQTDAEQENAPKGKRQKLCRECSAKLDEQADAEKRAIQRATHIAHLQRISVVNFIRFMD